MFSMTGSKGGSLGKSGALALADMGMKNLSPGEMIDALRQAGEVIINSTKVGYLREVSPSGDKWAQNPEWYSVMKGKAATLTGPTRKKISDGKYSGYEFKKINTSRLKNSLIKTVTTTKVTVKYESGVQKRANKLQVGGESVMILVSQSGRDLRLKINIQKREHLGVAYNYNRLGSKTDDDHIEEIFGNKIVTIL